MACFTLVIISLSVIMKVILSIIEVELEFGGVSKVDDYIILWISTFIPISNLPAQYKFITSKPKICVQAGAWVVIFG